MDVLKLITVQSHPYRYAKIQVNLGKIQFSVAILIKDNPEEKTSHLLKAIEFYHHALTLLNKDHYPIDYKNAKNLLTKTHLEFSKISSQFQNHLDIAHSINDEVLSFYEGAEKKDLLYTDAINLQKEINEAFNQGLTHA